MKHEKLKQICKKSKQYSTIAWCLFIPAFILALLCLASRVYSEQINDLFIGWCLMTGFIIIVASLVISRLEAKWYRRAEDYVAIKIMDAINEFGIDSGKFELIQESPVCYKVGFHNQMVDYEALQSKLDEEITAMNKITGWVTTVELI